MFNHKLVILNLKVVTPAILMDLLTHMIINHTTQTLIKLIVYLMAHN